MQPVATNTAIAAKNRPSCISGGTVVFPSPEHHSDKGYLYQGFRKSSGSLAIFAAIRRARTYFLWGSDGRNRTITASMSMRAPANK
jgi:hypothetical protein